MNTFLQALIPEQTSLIELLEEQCNIYPQYMNLIKHLHILRTPCSRDICQGRILAGVKFTTNGKNDIPFPIAHPPFVYELKEFVRRGNEHLIKSYMNHLNRYLTKDIYTDSCILCLSFDLYCKNKCEVQNFRLFFLEKENALQVEKTIDFLYDPYIETTNKASQCSLFDVLLNNITLLCLQSKQNEASAYVVRYYDEKKKETVLYF